MNKTYFRNLLLIALFALAAFEVAAHVFEAELDHNNMERQKEQTLRESTSELSERQQEIMGRADEERGDNQSEDRDK